MKSFLRGFPAPVLELAADGTVKDSNGRLEEELGRELVGRRFDEVLDRGSSGEKWSRLLGDAESLPAGAVWELIFRGRDTPSEPRTFSIAWEEDPGSLWLVEHPRDPRMESLRSQVEEVNSDLVGAQRELVREKAELNRLYRETERLAQTVQLQNEELEARNRQLVDLTEELSDQRRELERSNRDLDAFAHVVSHDLKAPLRAIGNYAHWLEEDLEGRLTGEAREHMDLLRARVDRLQLHIDGTLRYARVGREPHRPERLEVGELVRGVVGLLSPSAEAHVEVESGMPTIETDRAQLEQVFLNLVGNALKYTPGEDARIRVTVRNAGDFYEFAVEDNGPGIAPPYQQRIWELFHTGELSSSADSTGIGLAVVKKLVEGQGGKVWVESDGATGATFRFQWPKSP